MMRLGWRQLDVLMAADQGKARTRHSGQGRFYATGLTEPQPERVLDSLLNLELVALGEEEINGHRLVLTPKGQRELDRRMV